MEESNANKNIINRVGKMCISEEALLSEDITEAFKILDIRIARAEFIFINRCFEYYFYSKFAEVVEEGCDVPEYVIDTINTNFDQKVYELVKC